MSGSHVEVESKLALPAEAVGAVLAGLPFTDLPGVHAVEQVEASSLVAVYHDTEDLALLRDGVTLRRRTGGTDEGWHLKLPVADGVRLEQHEPLGEASGAVPARLVALSRSRHRERRLVPVATLTTVRRTLLLKDHDGRVLAEVADDSVEASLAPGFTAAGRPQHHLWRELEVELVAGRPALLVATVRLLRREGAVPASYGSKLGRACAQAGMRHTGPDRPDPGGAGGVLLAAVAEQVAVMVATDPAVRLDSPDAVHAMRVAARRIRSLLAAFRPWLQPGSDGSLREELRWLGRVLGGPRDAEVLRARIECRVAQLPGPRPTASRVRPDLRADVGSPSAVAALDDDRYLALLEDLDRFLRAAPTTPGGRRVGTRKAARRAYHRVVRAHERVPAAPGPEQDAALHEVRKAAKRLRYTSEAVTAVHPRAAARLAVRAEALQELLGEHQDSVLTRQVLHGAAGRTTDTEEAFLLGTLNGLEVVAGTEAVREVDRTVRRLSHVAERWFGAGPR